ncbi:MAG TPA: proton-conducting transporter membrane subunit [Noviherbaspirillum sp.]|nr:proton-conducting transporter membrane subunit [Noviherbaspirillum sp.]
MHDLSLHAIAWLILLPLAWASAAFLLGPGRGAGLAVIGLALQLLLAISLAVGVVDQGPLAYQVGGWGAPLGIDLLADGLSSVMLLLTQVVALPLALYAHAYFSQNPKGVTWFWPLVGYLVAAMNALFLSADAFNIYVTLELVGLAAVGLVAVAGGVGPVTAALRYLLTTLLGSGAYLLGVALLYGTYGTVSLEVLGPLIAEQAPLAVAMAGALMLFGMLLKTALFPFHFWLPPAHGGAPAPVSAILSALVIKASFYLVVRFWLSIFEPLTDYAVAQLLGLFGAGAVLWGSLQALQQTRLKMLVAYSTVAQVGYLFLLFPLVTGTPEAAANSAVQGVIMQALAHGLAKAAMFTAAGAMVLSMERDDISRLGGLSSHMPQSLFAFGLAGVTLMGLPPSAGFLAKWLLIDAAIHSGQWGWIVMLIAGGLLTAAYVFKVLRQAFLQVEQDAHYRPLPRMLEWVPLVLALASLALGVRASEIILLTGVR